MNEINNPDGFPVGLNKRQSLQSDIANLKKNIKNAQAEVENSNLASSLQTSISPEQANESKKKVVFLRKDLAAKQSEYEQLDQ